MKKIVLIAFLALALMAACGGGASEEAPAAVAAAPAFDPATAGAMTGTVTLEGQSPLPSR